MARQRQSSLCTRQSGLRVAARGRRGVKDVPVRAMQYWRTPAPSDRLAKDEGPGSGVPFNDGHLAVLDRANSQGRIRGTGGKWADFAIGHRRSRARGRGGGVARLRKNRCDGSGGGSPTTW